MMEKFQQLGIVASKERCFHSCVFREIQQLVLDKQQAVNAADLAKRKFSAAEQEVSEMRQRIATLQGSLVDAERAVVSEKGEFELSVYVSAVISEIG